MRRVLLSLAPHSGFEPKLTEPKSVVLASYTNGECALPKCIAKRKRIEILWTFFVV